MKKLILCSTLVLSTFIGTAEIVWNMSVDSVIATSAYLHVTPTNTDGRTGGVTIRYATDSTQLVSGTYSEIEIDSLSSEGQLITHSLENLQWFLGYYVEPVLKTNDSIFVGPIALFATLGAPAGTVTYTIGEVAQGFVVSATFMTPRVPAILYFSYGPAGEQFYANTTAAHAHVLNSSVTTITDTIEYGIAHDAGHTYEISATIMSAPFCIEMFTLGTMTTSGTFQTPVQESPSRVSGIRIYPNPVSEYFTIETEYPCYAILSDMTGTQVRTETVIPGTTMIERGNLQPGTYILSLAEKGKPAFRTKILLK